MECYPVVNCPLSSHCHYFKFSVMNFVQFLFCSTILCFLTFLDHCDCRAKPEDPPERDIPDADGNVECTKPDDSWVHLVTCDNIAGNASISCQLNKRKGIAYGPIGPKRGDVNVVAVRAVFKEKLATSPKTNHPWSSEPESTFKGDSDSLFEFSVPVGVKVQVSQAIGTCAHLTVFSGGFKRVDTKTGKADTEIQIQESESLAKFIQDIATFTVTTGDPQPAGQEAAKPADGGMDNDELLRQMMKENEAAVKADGEAAKPDAEKPADG